jgi:prepilin-type N-terminal cleavage/methylation domain-containing protein
MKSRGFTFVEILVVTAIIGAIGGISIPVYNRVTETANTNICAQNRKTLSDAESMYTLGEGVHTIFHQDLVDNQYMKSVPACPIGYEYTWEEYTPDDPSYRTVPICPEHNPGESPFSTYGNLIRSTRYLELYDSGVLLSKISDLKYVPDYENDTVFAALASGTQIQTDVCGGATITLADGTVKVVDDIYGSFSYLKNDFVYSEDRMEYSGDYMWVGYGYAYEGEYDRAYSVYDYNYDSDTGSYSYDSASTHSSDYSVASLRSDLGYIYEGSYWTNEPTTSSYKLERNDDGSYAGNSKYSGNNSTLYNYGYNRKGTKSQFTYSVDGDYEYSYDTDYAYDVSSKTYKSASKGRHAYKYDYDFGNDNTHLYEDAYNYKNTYAYNYNTRAYSATYAYEHDNGRSYTYNYSYNPEKNTYAYSYTDNVTGRTTTRKYVIAQPYK